MKKLALLGGIVLALLSSTFFALFLGLFSRVVLADVPDFGAKHREVFL